MLDPRDEDFHAAPEGDFYWTETAWWPFNVPDRNLSGMIYTLFRPVAGVCTAGIHIWDKHGSEATSAVYSRTNTHRPIPDGSAPTNYTLENGLICTRTEAFKSYKLEYEATGRLKIDLEFSGIQPPHQTGAKPAKGEALASWWGNPTSGHFDQPTKVHGEIELWNERLIIDCYSIRDRSWSSRKEQGSDWPPMGYAYATLDESTSFNTMTRTMPGDQEDEQSIVAGYFVEDGEMASIVSGKRTVLARTDGRASKVKIEFVDALDRAASILGDCQNSFGFLGNTTTLLWWSLTKWEMNDGTEFWGEDGESWWPPTLWTAYQRSL